MAVTTYEYVLVEGQKVAISNPDKLLWPEERISKLDYIRKLAELSPFLLQYCSNRYLTTIRYPDGIHKKSFYQKNCPAGAPPFVKTAVLNDIEYVNLDSPATLVWLANMGCLEFHPSLHYIHEDLPVEWLIDIDPSKEDEPRIMEAALIVGELLNSLHVQSVPKTSGATGVQIYVPIRRGYTFEQLRAVGHFIGSYLSHVHPKLFTIERMIKNRKQLIYIDYLQHWRGKTLSAPYTPRARAGAPVSTPLHWSEVQDGVSPRDFHLLNIQQRLRQTGDLIEQVKPQSLDHILTMIR